MLKPSATTPYVNCPTVGLPDDKSIQWTDLPHDVLRAVAEQLPNAKDYVRLMGTTRALNEALRQPEAVGRHLQKEGMSAQDIAALSLHDRLQELNRFGLLEHRLGAIRLHARRRRFEPPLAPLLGFDPAPWLKVPACNPGPLRHLPQGSVAASSPRERA